MKQTASSAGPGTSSPEYGLQWIIYNILWIYKRNARRTPVIRTTSPERGGCGHVATVKLNANRVVTGMLRGFDQFMNLVVDNTVEVNGNDKNDIGMVVIRGNSVVMIEALEPVAKPQ